MKDTFRHHGLRQQLVNVLKNKGITHTGVLAAVGKIPRHLFMDSGFLNHAYQDKAFPIGADQTISQPYTVAFQSELMQIKPGHKVLEIGTGSGYQTAVLSQLVDSIVSVECILKLHRRARDLVYDLGVRNVKFRHGDGFGGSAEHAPYDGILAAAVSDDVPQELIDQLAEGGRIVMPVSKNGSQWLIIIDKIGGRVVSQDLEAVRFVPRLSGLY